KAAAEAVSPCLPPVLRPTPGARMPSPGLRSATVCLCSPPPTITAGGRVEEARRAPPGSGCPGGAVPGKETRKCPASENRSHPCRGGGLVLVAHHHRERAVLARGDGVWGGERRAG